MNNISNFNLKTFCSGCSLCSCICKHSAIDMKLSKEGFLTPFINESICISCGECIDNCIASKSIVGEKTKIFLAAQTKNDDNLLIATSGGFFQELAQYYFLEGNFVYGVVYDDNMMPYTKCASSINDIKNMSGSKYVQSNSRSCYIDIEKKLLSKKKVLFSGVPCQLAGLKTYLKYKNVDTSNLFTIDFPCYGVPPLTFFEYTISEYEKKFGGKIIDFRFRDKKKNGFSHTTEITYIKDNEIKHYVEDDYRKIPYHFAFGERNLFQYHCYECEYIKKERISDITIGSFWGIEKYENCFDIKKGVSMICLNSSQAEEVWQKIREKFVYTIRISEEAYKSNSALHTPAKMFNRETIMKYLLKHGYKKTISKYFIIGRRYKISKFLSKIKLKTNVLIKKLMD